MPYKDPEKKREYRRRFYIKNRDAILENRRNYNVEHQEERRDYMRRYYVEHQEEILEKRSNYYVENRDVILEKKKNHHAENRDVILEKLRNYHIENRDAILPRKRLNNRCRRLEKEAADMAWTFQSIALQTQDYPQPIPTMTTAELYELNEKALRARITALLRKSTELIKEGWRLYQEAAETVAVMEARKMDVSWLDPKHLANFRDINAGVILPQTFFFLAGDKRVRAMKLPPKEQQALVVEQAKVPVYNPDTGGVEYKNLNEISNEAMPVVFPTENGTTRFAPVDEQIATHTKKKKEPAAMKVKVRVDVDRSCVRFDGVAPLDDVEGTIEKIAKELRAAARRLKTLQNNSKTR